jgi:hypothetical protein
MTAPPAVAVADDARAIAGRLHALARMRERYAVELFELWRTTPDGRRYEAATGAERGRRAGIGWAWCARQLRIMADIVEGVGEPPLPRDSP